MKIIICNLQGYFPECFLSQIVRNSISPDFPVFISFFAMFLLNLQIMSSLDIESKIRKIHSSYIFKNITEREFRIIIIRRR